MPGLSRLSMILPHMINGFGLSACSASGGCCWMPGTMCFSSIFSITHGSLRYRRALIRIFNGTNRDEASSIAKPFQSPFTGSHPAPLLSLRCASLVCRKSHTAHAPARFHPDDIGDDLLVHGCSGDSFIFKESDSERAGHSWRALRNSLSGACGAKQWSRTCHLRTDLTQSNSAIRSAGNEFALRSTHSKER